MEDPIFWGARPTFLEDKARVGSIRHPGSTPKEYRSKAKRWKVMQIHEAILSATDLMFGVFSDF